MIHTNSVSKWNFVVMDERSMTTFIFRVVQPVRFTSPVPLGSRPWWSLLAALRARLARGQGKKFVERWPSMRAWCFPDGKLDRVRDEFSTE